MAEQFENSPFFLVWRDGGGSPVFKHESSQSAQREASRLARECPGQRFYVLAPISEHVKADVTVRHFDIALDTPF